MHHCMYVHIISIYIIIDIHDYHHQYLQTEPFFLHIQCSPKDSTSDLAYDIHIELWLFLVTLSLGGHMWPRHLPSLSGTCTSEASLWPFKAFWSWLKVSGQAGAMGQRSNKRKEDVRQPIRMVSHTHTTKYSSDTLIGNWNTERFDVTKLAQSKCLPSQHSHYFETMYNTKTHKIVWIHWQYILLQSHCRSGALARDYIYYIIVHV